MANLYIPNVVGRRWDARGGARHRVYGGYGGHHVQPCYAPATEEIVELSPGAPVRITTSPRVVTLSGLAGGRGERELADLGALMTPGSRGLTVRFSLDADHRLHGCICIDGECYEGSVDLSAVLDRIAERVASYHTALHAAPSPASEVADNPAAAEATNAAVEAAGDLLVGALIDQHCATMSAGWWKSLGKAVYGVHHAVAKTVQKFKVPITVAASAVASVYGGPAGGAAAAQFTGPLIDAVANDFGTRKDAQAVVDAAEAAAQTDPRVAKALGDAHKAVADTAAAYHLTSIAADAAGGDENAARKLADLDRAAGSGDTAAQRAMAVIAEAFAAAGRHAGDRPTTSGASALLPFALGAAAGAGGYAWWRRHHERKAARAAAAIERPAETPPPEPEPGAPIATELVDVPAESSSPAAASGELIGAAITTLRRAAQAAVVAAHERHGATALGFVKDAHVASVLPFPSLDDADDWFGDLDPRHYLYAAYFDSTDPTWPSPIHERLGGPAAASAHRTSSAQVGASIWQTPTAIQSELESINSEFMRFAHDFERFLKTRGYPTNVPPGLLRLVELYEYVWMRLLAEWKAFYAENDGWWDNFWWNHAPEAEEYRAKLVDVQNRAEALAVAWSRASRNDFNVTPEASP